MTIGLIANNDGTGAVQLGGSNAISLDTSFNATMAGYVNAPNTFGFKNRIINGAMVIDQRNNGASVTFGAGTAYTLDRWFGTSTAANKFSLQQNAGAITPPVGFSNYLGVTSLSAYNVQASDTFYIQQSIEGFNTSDLSFGTANAATITLSFKVYSSLTGTFGGALLNSAANRSYPFSYSVPVSNTWTTISVTIAGDTTGTWIGATNGLGIAVRFGIGSGSTYMGTAGAWAAGNLVQPTGSVSVVGTSGATFYITGVQLEKGSTATSFDFRDYGRELMMCQRYYQELGTLYYTYYGAGGTHYLPGIQCLLASMRATPSFSTSSISYYGGTISSMTPTYFNGYIYASASISGAGFGGYYGTIKAAAEL